MKRPTAFITGASGAIGKACAERLAPDYRLLLHCNSNPDLVRKTAVELSGVTDTDIYQHDLSTGEELPPFPAENIHVFLHCAGNSSPGLFQDTHPDEWTASFNIACKSPVLFLKQITPHMIRRRKGKIIFVSSIWGETGASMETVYSTVKSAQHGLVKSLGKELAASNIQVNAVAPGAVDTAMLSAYSESDKQMLRNDIPADRLGTPEEIANTAAFLASDHSSYMNGQIIHVNGGWHT
ncbi:elongation factor P 5-aminopentanone reductase [Alkalicoccus luteus]|uniref:SDR family oxidoreductase n=1 Tax=Alkalicoccus luteus TaxID=1237094 RepID=A0A969TVF0_9BACI|nr:SDR family oxidoreductase [Alkalicoccus luteus]